MSSFTTPLIVSPTSNGRDWKLYRAFTYHLGTKYSRDKITVPAGFKTDFASIPNILFRFLFWWLPWWAKFNKAPVLHDYLYQKKEIMGKPITRKRADDVFLEAMLVEWRHHKSRCVLARLEYLAVRIFAFWAWEEITSEA